MAQRSIYRRSGDPASVDEHTACEARVEFLARQLAEVLEATHDLRRQRDIARRQVRNLRAELATARGAAWA